MRPTQLLPLAGQLPGKLAKGALVPLASFPSSRGSQQGVIEPGAPCLLCSAIGEAGKGQSFLQQTGTDHHFAVAQSRSQGVALHHHKVGPPAALCAGGAGAAFTMELQ